ncbi:UDP-3-O-(3-hydroxymyristoyl)glucosamine N-acyltransferase [Fusibacter tunisiensis]|uniref:UDP-3-O-[3-hydroxymyristoyl] glucosamine N-acyltransferase n=1 Tax=Fusibacter tunisiensis TaxID=1008308 RepID=A0ABS2MNB2_9FIRM|nr:UDP-3-O-(3-hydroxymyristoyl)glucosamine N-acyltransferase [Fusibacter tunisiensis]MBM7560892.1 UDP-3-O-[3-hydroxymyristoyl] glucosamine N-acyltransferase [Fusibacter tunisiensis]
MRIIELKEVMANLEVMNDSEFNALGMATTKFNNERVLAFFSDEKYLEAILDNKNIVALITTKQIYDKKIIPDEYGLIISDDPKLQFYEIHNKLVENEFYWAKFENKIADTAVISDGAYIEDHSIVIGENSVIEAGVVIHSGSIIGDNVIIRSGCKIGTNGFQFLNDGTKVISVKTGGRAVIKDNVEIQHNCCVDRGVLGGDTILSKYVKLDNFIHVAHDDIIGERTFITAGVKLAGRVTIGEDCWIGVNATISNGITIGNNCKITLGAVVTRSVPDNSTVSGNFAIEHSRFIDFIKSIR